MDLARREAEANRGPLLLLVEDEPDDQTLFCLAVERSGLELRLHIASNALEAVDYLRGGGAFGQAGQHPLPDLLVVDLGLPLMDGFEFLRLLKETPRLQGIPVMVMTGSYDPEWKKQALELGAVRVYEKFARIEEGALLVQEMAHTLSSFSVAA